MSTARPIATLVNYGCHPTTLGPDNTLYSADFPGVACAAVRGRGRRRRDLLDRAAGRREPGRLFARGQHGRRSSCRGGRSSPPSATAGDRRRSRAAVHETPAARVRPTASGATSRVVELRSQAPPGCRRRAAPRPTGAARRRPIVTGADLSQRRHVPRARGRGLCRPHRVPGRGPRARRARSRSAISALAIGPLLHVGVGGRAVRGARPADPAARSATTPRASPRCATAAIGYIPTADAFEIGGYEPNASVLVAGRGRAARRRDDRARRAAAPRGRRTPSTVGGPR